MFSFQLVFSCKWLSPVVTAELSCLFHRPFSIRHVLLSSESKWVWSRAFWTNPEWMALFLALWLVRKTLKPHSQPIRCKTKTNHDLVARALGYLLIFPWSSTWLYKVFPFFLIGHLRIPEEDFLVYTNGISLKKGCWHYFLTWCGFLNSFFSRFVQVIVSGINPIDLVISAPQLIITNCSSVKVTPLHSSVEYVSVSITTHSQYLHFLFLAIYLWFYIF